MKQKISHFRTRYIIQINGYGPSHEFTFPHYLRDTRAPWTEGWSNRFLNYASTVPEAHLDWTTNPHDAVRLTWDTARSIIEEHEIFQPNVIAIEEAVGEDGSGSIIENDPYFL